MDNKNKPKNPYTVTSIVFLILTIVFIFMIFLPSILNMDMMRWGFGIVFISFFLVISFAITSGVYASMAKRLNNVFTGLSIIAHWKYTQEEWLEYSKDEFKKQKSEKWGLFILIAAITIIVGGIFILTHRDAWKALSIVFAGLLLILALTVIITTKGKYAKDSKNINPEVYISLNGIYLAGEFHVWNFLSSKLEDVNFDENKMLILVNYSYVTRTGLNNTCVRIPVPLSKFEDAKAIVDKLRNI
jgi:hypothetical protein